MLTNDLNPLAQQEIRILLIDDEEDTFLLVRRTLRDIKTTKYSIDWVSHFEEGIERIKQKDHDIYIVDYNLGQHTGIEVIESVANINAPLIVLTGNTDYKIDIEAMKKGASDFLSKDLLIAPVLERSIRYALERKRTQRELLEAKTNQLKSEFLKTMTHELRTPMNGIIGSASLLSETTLNSEQRVHVQEILHSSQLLLGIIGDVLDLATLSGGGLSRDAKEFDLKATLAKTAGDYEKQALEKGIEFSMSFSEKVPHCVLGDELRIALALSHLIENAVKFTSSGKVEIKCETETENKNKISLKFTVKDTGIGISREGCERLFLPFSQVDGSTTRRFGGTGLGLAIAKKSVDLLGGEIGVESVREKGSTFWFKINVDRGTGREKETESFQTLFPKKEKKEDRSSFPVLVVEDCVDNQNIIARMLKKLNRSVKIVQNGKEALDILREKPDFSVVLMDLHMPIMDGHEATAEIRKIEGKQRHIPIIALTADDLPGTRQKCVFSGMDGYYPKPITFQVLKQILEKFV